MCWVSFMYCMGPARPLAGECAMEKIDSRGGCQRVCAVVCRHLHCRSNSLSIPRAKKIGVLCRWTQVGVHVASDIRLHALPSAMKLSLANDIQTRSTEPSILCDKSRWLACASRITAMPSGTIMRGETPLTACMHLSLPNVAISRVRRLTTNGL